MSGEGQYFVPSLEIEDTRGDLREYHLENKRLGGLCCETQDKSRVGGTIERALSLKPTIARGGGAKGSVGVQRRWRTAPRNSRLAGITFGLRKGRREKVNEEKVQVRGAEGRVNWERSISKRQGNQDQK